MLRLLLKTILGVLLIGSFPVFGQLNEDIYYEAEDLLEDGNFHKALNLFQDLLNQAPNNANLNFKVGYCYLNTATEKIKSVSYLEFAAKKIVDDYKDYDYKETGAPLETLYYLGKAYHVSYRFEDAERVFFELKKLLSNDDEEFIERIDYELAACQAARVLMKSPVEMTVTNLGRAVNSPYSEHSPVISGDESILIFTSKREGNTGNKRMDDGQYFEDIYISSFNGKRYSQAKKISENINTSGHEASIGLSFDGSKLFIYRDDDGDGNIYMSTRKGSEWMVPVKLDANINTKYRETHACMSFDQNQIFFTSNRKGGFGGLDIYRVRKLPNGKWSKAQNLGARINTKYDEEGPYFHPDGTTLFFASQGHNSMGGFDIFISFLSETDKWSVPENIGYPINTPDDDVYYVPSVDGRRAYYSSYANNSLGNYDIFRIDLAESHIRNQTVIAGYAITPSGERMENPIITVTDMDDEVIGIYTPDIETGKFLFILPRGRTYNAYFESSNADELEYTINVPTDAYDQSKQVVIFNQVAVLDDKEPEVVYALDIAEESEPLDTEEEINEIVADKVIENQKDDLEPNKKIILADEISQEELLVSSELNMYEETEATEQTTIGDTTKENRVNQDDEMLVNRNKNVRRKNKRSDKKQDGIFGKNRNVSLSYPGYFFISLIGIVVIIALAARRKKNK